MGAGAGRSAGTAGGAAVWTSVEIQEWEQTEIWQDQDAMVCCNGHVNRLGLHICPSCFRPVEYLPLGVRSGKKLADQGRIDVPMFTEGRTPGQ